SLMPFFRTSSATFTPASACFSTPMIFSSLNRDFFTRSSPVGKLYLRLVRFVRGLHVCLVPDPVDFCIAQDMVAVRADDGKIYPRFLFAALRSQIVQQRIGTLHVGT